MAIELGAAYISILPSTAKLAPALKKDMTGAADTAGREAGGKFTSGFKKTLKVGAAVGAGLAIAAGGKFLKESVREASNLGESLNAVNVTFGKNAAGIKKLGEQAADSLGLSNSEFNGLAVQFSAFTKTIAGKGGDVTKTMKDLTLRGADFASVMNLEVNEAMGIFQSGLAGESEPLRKFGIDLSAAAVESHAYAKGIADAGDELTEGQKVQARYSLLMKQTSKVQGDFANTSGSLANVQRRLGANWDDLQAMVGMKVLPTLEKLSGWVLNVGMPALVRLGGWVKDNVVPTLKSMGTMLTGTVIPALRGLVRWGRDNIGMLKGLAAVVGSGIVLLKTYQATVAVVNAVTKAWTALTKGQTLAQRALNLVMRLNPIGIVITALTALAGALVVAYNKSETFRNIVDGAWRTIRQTVTTAWRDGIKPVFQALKTFIVDTLPSAFRRGVEAITNAWDRIKEAARKPVNFVIETVYNQGIRAGYNKLAGLFNLAELPAMKAVGGAAPSSGRRPRGIQAMGGAGGLGSMVKTVGGKAWDWIKDKFMGPVSGALGRVGSSPWAQVAAGAAKKLAGGALGKLKGAFSTATEAGPIGEAGRVLPRGSYSIGMPYLGYPGHYGADYPAPEGTPIYSLAAGKVSRALSLTSSYGKHAFIDHPGGAHSRYAHMSELMVRPGQSVLAGQMIGKVGSTGNSTGNHLHFELWRGGSPVNPASAGIFDNGGILKPGAYAYNASSKPEAVLNDQQWKNTLEEVSGREMLSELIEETRGLRSDIRQLPKSYRLGQRQGAY